ncbi:glycosyltransferase family A protein [Albibacterium sp.]|uniref:glycosyltransferase family 2 protein n=1 Tax=Albibacterium sp. TaxID=2952885 RepID=UPI002B7001C5|nr:glycosyltransferase family A protein [Albibacterium sp.]HUH19104.1 glycosyltransferase family A protein [Albibacterium sp.]
MIVSDLVSVVIPCYNQAVFIEETVNSVLDSSYPNIEIILVNDGSIDNTEEVCKRLSRQYENVFYYSQANQGPSIARNHGIRKAKGVFILPLDSDDIISSDYISEAIKAFKSDPEVKVVYCEAEKFGEKEGKWKLKPFSLKRLALDNMIFVSALYKKKDWEACGGYSEDMVWGREDWEFWITMLKNGGKVVKLPITGFYYRIRTNSRRKGMTKERKEKIIEYINRKHREFIYGQLNGPLRFQRTHSRKYNTLLKMLGLLK